MHPGITISKNTTSHRQAQYNPLYESHIPTFLGGGAEFKGDLKELSHKQFLKSVQQRAGIN